MNQHAPAPEFAMSFTQEAVLLERREGHGWHILGEARFSGRDMAATLNALRGEAGGAGGRLDTLLVIPDDQILYTSITVPVGSDTAAALSRALESMTPYPSADLAFDWCPSANGDVETLRVAAVARRTLEEAEDFARAQGFFPSGFIARPGDTRFHENPDFGQSRLATEHGVRQPFSEPDLTQARITAPVVDEISPPQPMPSGAVEPIISRITPHHFVAHVPAEPTPQAEAPAIAASVTPLAEEADMTERKVAATNSAPAVIRHGDGKAAPKTGKLSPRAEAVHQRAAEARSRRAKGDDSEKTKRAGLAQRLMALNPGRLPVLMGLLVAGLLMTLVLFGGGEPATDLAGAEPEVASTNEEVTDQTAAVVPQAAEPTDQAQAQPAETAVEAPPPSAANDVVALGPADPVADDEPVETPADEVAAAEQPATEVASDDPLARALNEAMQGGNAAPDAEAADLSETSTAQSEAAAASADAPRIVSSDRASTAPSAEAAARAASAASALRLRSSGRPPSAPPTRAAAPAVPDAGPAVPSSPLPFAQRGEAEPPRVTGIRPPERPAAQTRPAQPEPAAAQTPALPASQPAAQPAETPVPAASPRPSAAQPLGSSSRPPSRPDSLTELEEGSSSEDRAPTTLTATERDFLLGLLQDLRTAQAGNTDLSTAEHDVLIRLADARPARKPVSVGKASEDAVRAAVAQAVATSERPASRSTLDAAPPAKGAVGAMLVRSSRPLSRPAAIAAQSGGDPGPGRASLSGKAVEDAIADAVANSSALPGAVALTALATSALPPRRSGGRAASAEQQPTAPSANDLRTAAEAQQREAAMAEQRRMDDALQAQAEARARARASADAQAEANARAQAEARARAQAQAEARAAASRKQTYTPPEAEKEPEIAANVPVARGQGSAAANATVKDGITLNRTQIIGTVGAGKASRALVRLTNGRVVTLRLGDKINGGTITDIGNSQITFVKSGRQQRISVLNGQ